MNIVSCIDDNFALYCGVMLTSLFENNKDENVTVHIVVDTISNFNKNNLVKIVSRYGQSIKFYGIDSDIVHYCPVVEGRYTLSTYYRILLPSLLSNDISKVLYLDSDIIIRGRIDELWNIDIRNFSCGVVIDSLAQSIDEIFDRLEYSKDLKYFNAGVMLMNLDYWRKYDLQNETLSFIRKNPEKIKIVDQDALNYILRDSKLIISYKYNVLDPLYRVDPIYDKADFCEINDSIKNPIILHFSQRKPWKIYCLHPLRNEYYKYLKISKLKTINKRVMISDIKWIVSLFLFKINLLKRESYNYIRNI